MQLRNTKAEQEIPVDLPYIYRGTSLFPARDLQYAEQVRASDILLIDFDAHGYRGEGLYVIEHLDEHQKRVDWRGARLLTVTPRGIEMDQDGRRDWQPVVLEDLRCRIAGHIRTVYRPVE